jgi:hypothetical protein
LYEIKTSIEIEKISEYKDQFTRLSAIMGGRDIKIVRSPCVWDWSLGQWRDNPFYKRSGIILKGVSAAISIQGIW